MTELRDIQIGDTLEWEQVLDAHRGAVRVKRGVIVNKTGRNIEVDQQGSLDWLWWPQLKNCRPQIIKEPQS